ncbi:hypothetical protein PVK06_024587 [Gossypium arboreum]|uniref:Uncharacterized protein n=1 Tax=Gossypium arboreum TaxID=29729 RepID=A0ABR0PE46_GOSAR|nr:hypothetical protein PVK06_024587 [Gossypium arboreum]
MEFLILPEMNWIKIEDEKPFDFFFGLSVGDWEEKTLENIKKSPRVADENMYGGGGNSNNNNGIFIDRRLSSRGSWNGISVICNVVRAPLSLVSCFFSQPHIDGATDGVWVSTEIAQISEMNHLMVSDSMRYAILM